jgi:hypothetical protein
MLHGSAGFVHGVAWGRFLALNAHLIKNKISPLVEGRGACLHDIETCLNISLESPYHLGITAPVARTTLPVGNERRNRRMSEVLGDPAPPSTRCGEGKIRYLSVKSGVEGAQTSER